MSEIDVGAYNVEFVEDLYSKYLHNPSSVAPEWHPIFADFPPEAVKLNAARLEQRVAQLLGEGTLGPDELAREVALLADKSDVAEEVQRLRSHVEQLRGVLETGASPVGRKLEFLAQELHRESNTIGSKNHDPVIAAATLELKLLVERVREQVANVE